MSHKPFTISFEGISAISDIALWKHDRGDNTFVMLNLYGSESQLRGIFSAIVGSDVITVKDDTLSVEIRRSYCQSSVKYKSWKMGYGKYQAVIRDDNILTECIVAVGDVVNAWDNFLKKRRIPYLKEWIPDIMRLLQRDGLVTKLEGLGTLSNSWHWNASDDEVCDLIVKEIYTKAKAAGY